MKHVRMLPLRQAVFQVSLKIFDDKFKFGWDLTSNAWAFERIGA